MKSAEELFRARKDIIGFFEKGIFPPLKVVYLKEKKKKQKKNQKKNQKKQENSQLKMVLSLLQKIRRRK